MGLPQRGGLMEEVPSQSATAQLIRSLPNLPKARLVELWKDNFGKEPGRVRPELGMPGPICTS